MDNIQNAPFGYNNVRDDKRKPALQIDETRAPVVRFIFQQFINGVSPRLSRKKPAK